MFYWIRKNTPRYKQAVYREIWRHNLPQPALTALKVFTSSNYIIK